MTTHRMKLAGLWAVAAGVAVAGGTSAIAVADNHGVSPKPLSQPQVAQQLADAEHAPTVLGATTQVRPQTKPTARGPGVVVTTRGGTEKLSCTGSTLNFESVTPANGWRALLEEYPAQPSKGPANVPTKRLITMFVQWPLGHHHDDVQVTARCQGGTPKWTVTPLNIDRAFN